MTRPLAHDKIRCDTCMEIMPVRVAIYHQCPRGNMGDPTIPTQADINEALALAQEHLEAVNNDDESWLDRLPTAAIQGGEQWRHGRYMLYVMMIELVRTRPIVLAARAETRVNGDCSPSLKAAVDGYEHDEVSPFGETD